MAYKGKFTTFQNPSKYVGDINNITYRSLWERNVMIWLDTNPEVEEWASEEIFFHYDNPVTGKRSKYYPDFYVKMKSGQIRIIEVKPKRETEKPAEPKRRSKQYINEVAVYVVNQQKWKAATEICVKNKMSFEVWTEETLTRLGIMKNFQARVPKEIKKTQAPKSKPKRPRPTRKS